MSAKNETAELRSLVREAMTFATACELHSNSASWLDRAKKALAKTPCVCTERKMCAFHEETGDVPEFPTPPCTDEVASGVE